MTEKLPKVNRTLTQLRKEHKPAKAFTFTVAKDFELVFEDFNYFDEDHQDKILAAFDKMNGGVESYVELAHAGDELLALWIGEDQFKRLAKDVKRYERSLIAVNAMGHFQQQHGEDDPKDR